MKSWCQFGPRRYFIGAQNILRTINTRYLSDNAISIHSRRTALSMDACKLHSNVDREHGDPLAGQGPLCILRGRSSAGDKNVRRGDHSFPFFFPRYFPEILACAIHRGWEALWYVTDMNAIHLSSSFHSMSFIVVTLRLLRETLSAFLRNRVRATMWSWQISWRSLILFKGSSRGPRTRHDNQSTVLARMLWITGRKRIIILLCVTQNQLTYS